MNCTRLLKIRNKLKIFVEKNFWYFVGVFNKTIIPPALVGYEMIIDNSALRTSLANYTISYPTRTFGIIVKYILD